MKPDPTPTAPDQHRIPAQLRRDVALIEAVLSPQLHQLLRTDDPDLLAERLLRLDVDRARPSDAAEVDQAVAALTKRHASAREEIARVLMIVAGVLAVGALAALLASFALSGFHQYVGTKWLEWPPHPAELSVILAVVLLAWFAGMAATQLRAQERARLARLACGVVSTHELATWPGIAIDSPFRALARRWHYFGLSFVVLAVAAVIAALAIDGLGVTIVLVALLWLGVGVALLRYAQPWVRADKLAQRVLFVGKPE